MEKGQWKEHGKLAKQIADKVKISARQRAVERDKKGKAGETVREMGKERKRGRDTGRERRRQAT